MQLLLATGSTQPWRHSSSAATATMPLASSSHLSPSSSASPSSRGSSADDAAAAVSIARRYGSAPALTHNPSPASTPPQLPYTQPVSRRSSPSLNSRSTLSSLSSHLSSRLLNTRGLLLVLCAVHVLVLAAVLVWLFSSSLSSSFSSSLASSGVTFDALLSNMDLKSLHYSPPVSIRQLSSDDQHQHVQQSEPAPASVQAGNSSAASKQLTEQSWDAGNRIAEAHPFSPSPLGRQPSHIATPLPAAALGTSLAVYLNQLQHEQCPSSSFPARSLIYSCSANAVHLEHDNELYDEHSIAGLYAVLRAATLAAASSRTLLIDDSQCEAVRSLQAGVERDAGLLCCEWRSLFQPLSSCALPEGASSLPLLSNVQVWSDAAAVQYDASQECMWEEETWAAMTTLFPDSPSRSVVRSLAAQLFRPSDKLAASVASLSSSLPASSLALHIPPFSIESDRRSNFTFASAVPLRIYINTARMHALTIGHTSLALLAQPEQIDIVREALPHLAVSDVWSLARQSVAEVAEDVRWAAMQASVVSWAASQSEWWVGVHQSILTHLVAVASNVSVLDVSGDRWTSSCWSVSTHTLPAEIVLPRAYNLPAISALTSGGNASTARVPLVLLLGSAMVGVPLLKDILTDSSIGFVNSEILSQSYAELFKARDYTVPAYAANRASFISALRSAIATTTAGSRGLLLHFHRAEKDGKERALLLYHHPSFLAQLVNAYQLPISVQVLVLARDPTTTLRSLMSGAPEPAAAIKQTRVLYEARQLRDVIYGVEAETAAMDVSVYRVFNHERLWSSDSANEAARMAAFLQLSADARDRLVELLPARARHHIAENFPPAPTWVTAEDDGQRDTYTAMSTLELYNHQHPAHRTSTHDYHKSFAAAVTTVKQHPTALSFAEQLLERQAADCTGPLLVFDGFINWSPATSRASSQLLDVVRSFTLALSTGRTLIVPQLAGTVLERLQPVSACNWKTAALGWEIEKQDTQWKLIHSGDALPSDAFSNERVVMTHSAVVDLAYLAAWNGENAGRSLGVHQFIRSLLAYVLRPVTDPDLSSIDASLLVSVPQIVSQPPSYYVEAISALMSVDGYSSVRLSAAPTPFAQRTMPSFLAHADSELLQTIADILRNSSQVDVRLGLYGNATSLEQQLAEILYALNSRSPFLGSLGTEDGFLLASLVAPQRWSDLFGYQYLPSLLTLNQHALLTAPSTDAGQPYTPLGYRSKLVMKTKYSDRCRFVYVAGVEGTGHHGIGHLLTSLRVPALHSAPYYKQLDADEHISNFIWKMFQHQSYTFHERVKKQLAVRLAWRMQQATRNTAAGEPAVVVINGIRENEGGMQSYPNTDQEDKVILHPDLQQLAAVFESNGADLRIITLSRNGGSSLASTIKREHAVQIVGKAHAFYYQARVLRLSLAALSADLAALDPAFAVSLSMEMIEQQPELVGRRLAAIMSLKEDEVVQACIRMREEVHVAPSNHWRLSMNVSELQLADDMIGLGAYLPLNEGFRFLQVGKVGGHDMRVERTCRTLSIRPRPESKDVAILAVQGGGAPYLQRLVEESTAVLASTHAFDRVLPPSTHYALPSLTTRGLTAFSLTELPLDNPVPEFDYTPNLLLTRNPLDIALSVALPELQRHVGLSHHKLHDLMSWRGISWRNTHMGTLITQMTAILLRVAEQYVRWVTVWKVAERRKAMLEGIQGDGVLVLRLEDLVAGGRQQLTDLLDVLDLSYDNVSVSCVQAARDTLPHPPRLMSNLSSPMLRTSSNNLKLLSAYSTLQEQLLLSAYPPMGTGSLPVAFVQLISPNAFTMFRAIVDDAATAVEGTDWARYVAEVQPMVETQWVQQKAAPANNKRNAAAAAAAAAAITDKRSRAAPAITPNPNPNVNPNPNPNARTNPQAPAQAHAQSLDDQIALANRELENQRRKLGNAYDTSREALKAKQRLAQLQALAQRRGPVKPA